MDDVATTFASLLGQFAGNPRVAEGKWFGKTCANVDGKAFLVLFGGDVAFKLDEGARSKALQIEGAQLFDPRGQGKAFKEWVQVPSRRSGEWPQLAASAYAFVSVGAAV